MLLAKRSLNSCIFSLKALSVLLGVLRRGRKLLMGSVTLRALLLAVARI